ncbi:hypothetical protein NYR55_00080 [Sphingomonas sp. BGYR3]|nr:hypothetical protein [Sphingomonas sp. BGYR3]MDG5487025.1 hypothetical protein [Sphingomonas sp. BGYR3]
MKRVIVLLVAGTIISGIAAAYAASAAKGRTPVTEAVAETTE